MPFPEALYATDASNEKGGIAEASCGEEVLRALWLAADRKGSSVPIEAGFREALSQYDPLHEVLPTQKDGDPKGLRTVEEVDRPLGLCFEFIEILRGLRSCDEGAGKERHHFVAQFLTCLLVMPMTCVT